MLQAIDLSLEGGSSNSAVPMIHCGFCCITPEHCSSNRLPTSLNGFANFHSYICLFFSSLQLMRSTRQNIAPELLYLSKWSRIRYINLQSLCTYHYVHDDPSSYCFIDLSSLTVQVETPAVHFCPDSKNFLADHRSLL